MDVPRLAPLLHVVAQAAVVGLAQTVQLAAGGRQITATVQPVLRSALVGAEGSRRTHAAAAKVWITLSAPSATVLRRSSSIMPRTVTGFGSRGAGVTEMAHLMSPQSRGAGLDRRHSYQAFKQDHSFHAPFGAVPFPNQAAADDAASAASYFRQPGAAQTTSANQQHSPTYGKGREGSTQPTPESPLPDSQNSRMEGSLPVNDSLSMLMAQLEQENRNLQRQIDARRRRRQMQAQPFVHPFTQPQWGATPTQPFQSHHSSFPALSPSAFLGDTVPGSCPTRLQYLP